MSQVVIEVDPKQTTQTSSNLPQTPNISTKNDNSKGTDKIKSAFTYGKRDPHKGTGLKKCFTALVDRKQVCLDLDVLVLMLKKEMLIKMEALDEDFANTLPYLLIHYIKTWPGWQKSIEYFQGKIRFEAWYEKFHKYIVMKLNYAVTEGYKQALEEKREEVNNKISNGQLACRGSQTDNLAPKGFAPFAIEITVPPNAASTIVFTDDNNGNVILKHHNELEWTQSLIESVTLNQLVHWPNVEVHFQCPFFEFKRKNKHIYKRQIGLVSVPYIHETIDYIGEISVIDEKVERVCYTLPVLKEVCDMLVGVLRKTVKDAGKVEEIITVIDEFLSDIVEVDISRDNNPTMATNTSISFNIGRSSYFRNKKLSKGVPSRNDVNFVETIIPNAEINLIRFDCEKKAEEYLNILKNLPSSNTPHILTETLPKITYFCNYCSVNFASATELLAHLKDDHKMEQRILCTVCKKSESIGNLARDRWRHPCSKKQPLQ